MNSKKGLLDFKKKVDITQNITNENFTKTLSKNIAEVGKKIVVENYQGYSGINVNIKSLGKSYKVIAEDTDKQRPKIAYIEFGTGLVGKGTYPGKLPTNKIIFPVNYGDKGTNFTNGWEYYYSSPYKADGGWYYGKDHRIFTAGQTADAVMWRSAKELRLQLQDIFEKTYKGEML